MQLPVDDMNLFFKLHPAFLYYANQRMGVVAGVDSLDRFMALPFHDKNEIRNRARSQPELIRSFVRDNPAALNDVELAIVDSWRYALDGSFYVMRYDEDHAVFLDTGATPKAYGVTCLKKNFREIFGETLPVYVKTILMPFKNRIIYDGFLFTYPVTFDPPIVQELEADLSAWVDRYGIITHLPFIGETPAGAAEDTLRYYLRSQRNRDVYAAETDALLAEHPGLKKAYLELSGRLDAREARGYFRELGIRDVWCAVLNGRILTSGKNREAVTDTLHAILPKDRKLFPYIFHFKG
ncbi:hypothetical protein JXA80_12135 [bacterium]|nr:hypothetical protein [candidate division CSSED10-310 bacterium]